MTSEEFDEISKLGIQAQFGSLSSLELIEISVDHGVKLPADHLKFLEKFNGLLAYGGYFRLFGVDENSQIDLFRWNLQETWKFSWDRRLDDFFCFGGTAFGDQYAYKIDEMVGSNNQQVYFIEGQSMTPEIICRSFTEFLREEFLRNCIEPYDQVIVDTRKKYGDLSFNQHVVHTPSILITGVEDIDNIQIVDAISSMVIGGDLYKQLILEPQGEIIQEISTYFDDLNRTRLKINWKKI